jgi:hypothetical protein
VIVVIRPVIVSFRPYHPRTLAKKWRKTAIFDVIVIKSPLFSMPIRAKIGIFTPSRPTPPTCGYQDHMRLCGTTLHAAITTLHAAITRPALL